MLSRADMHESEKNYLEAIRLHKAAHEQMYRYSSLTPECKLVADSGLRQNTNSLARKALNEEGVPGGTILLNHTDITAAKEQFNDLLVEVVQIIENLRIKNHRNPKYDSVFDAAQRLNHRLSAGKYFFSSPTPEIFKYFTQQTKCAISEAEKSFSEHRGVWHKLHPILRGILGVLATLSLIPALIVAVGTKQGYVNTFFATPKTETMQQFESVKKKYEEQEDAIVDAFVNNMA